MGGNEEAEDIVEGCPIGVEVRVTSRTKLASESEFKPPEKEVAGKGELGVGTRGDSGCTAISSLASETSELSESD